MRYEGDFSLQDVFEFTVRGLVAQGGPASNSNGTCYYSKEGSKLRCAVGLLLTDEEAKKARRVFGPVSALMRLDFMRNSLLRNAYLNAPDLSGLLIALQSAHDEASLELHDGAEETWEDLLRERLEVDVVAWFDVSTGFFSEIGL